MSGERAYRWGRLLARHRWRVLGVWAVVLIACGASYPTLRKSISATDYSADGSQSKRAAKLLERRFPEAGAEQDLIVFHSDQRVARDPVFRAVILTTAKLASKEPYVRGEVNPFTLGGSRLISANGHDAIVLVGVAGSPRQLIERSGLLQEAVSRVQRHGIDAWVTGYSPMAKSITSVGYEDVERAEAIGVPVAVIVLLIALGGVVAAVTPLALAASGLVLTLGVLAAFAQVLTFDPYVTTIATMVGVGVGIDYSMFIVTRFREALVEHGDDTERAVAAAITTSGRTVLFSGGIVAVCLMALFIVKAAIFRDFAIAASSATLCTVITALTLLPAALGALGQRINRFSLPKRRYPPAGGGDSPQRPSAVGRWARATMRRPLLAAGVVSALLIGAASPVLGLRSGIDGGFLALSGTPAGKGEVMLARSFPPGALSPIQVVFTGPHAGPLARSAQNAPDELEAMLVHDPRVADMTILSSSSSAGLLSVAGRFPVDSPTSEALVRHIRSDLVPRLRSARSIEVLVGGATANSVDLSAETRAKFPLVVALVLGLALIFLTVTFRSVILPVKAVLMNLLATGATVGIVVLVFQQGHGANLLGFTSTGFIQVFLPLNVFALLFGLSMDYEVFLIRTMRESWTDTGNNSVAVTSGLERTARPISAAAAIMVAVFGCFVRARQLEIQEYGFALAVAIALDATLIRLVLVPSLMRVFGGWNWWLPRRLTRPTAVTQAGSEMA